MAKLEVVTAATANDCDAVVCMRVIDLPIPPVPSEIVKCSGCGERVWVAFSSPRKPPRLCAPCAMSRMAGDDVTSMVSERTVAEAIEYLRRQGSGT